MNAVNLGEAVQVMGEFVEVGDPYVAVSKMSRILRKEFEAGYREGLLGEQELILKAEKLTEMVKDVDMRKSVDELGTTGPKQFIQTLTKTYGLDETVTGNIVVEVLNFLVRNQAADLRAACTYAR